MADARRRVAVSWTGGKDCHLALAEVLEQPQAFEVVGLVTFAPDTGKPFLAHPIAVMKLQAEALGFSHEVFLVTPPDPSSPTTTSGPAEPWEEAYHLALTDVHRRHGATGLVTGDIEDVASGFMDRAVRGSGLELVRPLWERGRRELLASIQARGFEAVFSCANVEKCGAELAGRLVGSRLDDAALRAIEARGGVDLSGEGGEFHTMVTFVPGMYERRVDLSAGRQARTEAGDYWYWKVD